MKISFPILIFSFISSLMIAVSCSQTKQIALNKNDIRLVNRQYAELTSEETESIAMDAQNSSGLAILNYTSFETGIIEFDILGENNPGKSFVGLAFNIQNDSKYEAVYFRPFNFHSSEQIRREHCMQYIFHPDYPWHRLRKEREGQFEAVFTNPPSPDDWFRVRIIIRPETVIVEDPRSDKQLMKIERLTETSSDKIGFWTGFGSKGSFRNLIIKN